MTHTTNHTPGPWAVDQCSAPVYGSDGSLVAEGIGIGAQSTHIGTVYGKNRSHNAHLIAAAPAMYEALQWAKQYLRMPDFHPDNSYGCEEWASDYNTLIAALAQAEGK